MKSVLSRLEAFRIALKVDYDWQMDNADCVKAGQSNMCVLPIAIDEVTLQNYHTIVKYMEYFRNAICSHWRKREYTFYSWVDEMGGRICMSIVPEDCKPPFGASIEPLKSLSDVVRTALTSNSEILFEEMVEVDTKIAFDEDEDSPKHKIKVYIERSR